MKMKIKDCKEERFNSLKMKIVREITRILNEQEKRAEEDPREKQCRKVGLWRLRRLNKSKILYLR